MKTVKVTQMNEGDLREPDAATLKSALYRADRVIRAFVRGYAVLNLPISTGLQPQDEEQLMHHTAYVIALQARDTSEQLAQEESLVPGAKRSDLGGE